MTRELIILRHAKSSWTSDAPTDFDRPLAKRGKRDAPRMGKWMKQQRLIPDHVVSSPANRAKKTILLVCKELDIGKAAITWDRRIYMGELEDLLEVLAECPETAKRVILVGHNPGLDFLLSYLWGDDIELPEDDNLLPTATLAHLMMPEKWRGLEHGSAKVMSLVRPKSPEISGL